MKNVGDMLNQSAKKNFKEVIDKGTRLSYNDLSSLNQKFKDVYNNVIMDDIE